MVAGNLIVFLEEREGEKVREKSESEDVSGDEPVPVTQQLTFKAGGSRSPTEDESRRKNTQAL